MKSFLRRAAILIGATAVSVGLVGATAAPSHAAPSGSSVTATDNQSRDSGWG